LALSNLIVDVAPDESIPGFVVTANARVTGQTGVEMEALTAVSVACLTIYDMLKAVDRSMTIEAISVTEKHGGASGDYVRGDA
jgi:cyclic pyranopterin phosphate synthase